MIIGTPSKSRKARNVKRNNYVTILVDVEGPPTRGVIMYGKAQLENISTDEMIIEGTSIFRRYMLEDITRIYAKGLSKISEWVNITFTPLTMASSITQRMNFTGKPLRITSARILLKSLRRARTIQKEKFTVDYVVSMKINPGVVAAFSVSVIWGLSFVAAQMVLVTLSPILLATVRFTIATILFTPVILSEVMKGTGITRSDLMELAMLGFLSISIYFWLQYTGVKHAGAGVSALIVVGLIPVVTGILSSTILKEPFTRQKALGTLLGFSGVALITLPKLILGKTNTGFYLGIAALLGNTLCWSLYSALSRRLMQRTGKPLVNTAFATLFGTLTLIPMSLTSEWSLIRTLTLRQWGSIVYLATICSVAGYFLWNYALSRLEAVRAAVWLYIEPVAAFIGEALIFGAIPSTTTFTGGICIIAGATLTSLSEE